MVPFKFILFRGNLFRMVILGGIFIDWDKFNRTFNILNLDDISSRNE